MQSWSVPRGQPRQGAGPAAFTLQQGWSEDLGHLWGLSRRAQESSCAWRGIVGLQAADSSFLPCIAHRQLGQDPDLFQDVSGSSPGSAPEHQRSLPLFRKDENGT